MRDVPISLKDEFKSLSPTHFTTFVHTTYRVFFIFSPRHTERNSDNDERVAFLSTFAFGSRQAHSSSTTLISVYDARLVRDSRQLSLRNYRTQGNCASEWS
jgi:hypothetical protein